MYTYVSLGYKHDFHVRTRLSPLLYRAIQSVEYNSGRITMINSSAQTIHCSAPGHVCVWSACPGLGRVPVGAERNVASHVSLDSNTIFKSGLRCFEEMVFTVERGYNALHGEIRFDRFIRDSL